MEQLSHEEQERRYQAIIETAVDGIITIDSMGKIESVNAATCRLFGYDREEILGKNISFIMPSPHREAHDDYIRRYLSTGKNRVIGIGREVEGLRKNGTVFPFWLSVGELQLSNRVVFTGFVHDISALKAAEEEVRKLNIDLEKKVNERTEQLAEVVNKLLSTNKTLEREIRERRAAEKALSDKQEELVRALDRERELGELKSRFVSLASHEFRTPLSTILSSAALVRRYSEAGNMEKHDSHLEKIRLAVAHLTGILNDFLSLTKLEEGRVENKPEFFNFAEFCIEIIEEMRGLAKPGQEILHEAESDSIPVFLDRRILKNILYNLISNALKYSKKDVRCSAGNKLGLLEISIADDGIGIPEADQQYLFERFFRATNASNIQGTGLGLNIVKRYVDMLNGEITFTSQEGIGTVFTIKLPLGHEV